MTHGCFTALVTIVEAGTIIEAKSFYNHSTTMQFTKTGELGEGTFATVYRVKRNQQQYPQLTACGTAERYYALKLYKHNPQKHNTLHTVAREITAMKLLQNHPHIMSLMEVVKRGPNILPGLLMPLRDHTMCQSNFNQKLRSLEPADRLLVVKQLLKQLLQAVAHCHRHGVMHRDIKPGNIMLTRMRMATTPPAYSVQAKTLKTPPPRLESLNPFVAPTHPPRAPRSLTPKPLTETPYLLELTDFGLCYLCHGNSQSSRPQCIDPLVVTVWYRPPELLLHHPHYGFEIDVWSVGCVFAELVRGAPLFAGISAIGTLFQIFQVMGSPHALPPGSRVRTFYESLTHFKSTFPKWSPESKVSLEAFVPELKDAGLDLLKRMLALHPQDRCTAEEALQHPFFR